MHRKSDDDLRNSEAEPEVSAIQQRVDATWATFSPTPAPGSLISGISNGVFHPQPSPRRLCKVLGRPNSPIPDPDNRSSGTQPDRCCPDDIVPQNPDLATSTLNSHFRPRTGLSYANQVHLQRRMHPYLRTADRVLPIPNSPDGVSERGWRFHVPRDEASDGGDSADLSRYNARDYILIAEPRVPEDACCRHQRSRKIILDRRGLHNIRTSAHDHRPVVPANRALIPVHYEGPNGRCGTNHYSARTFQPPPPPPMFYLDRQHQNGAVCFDGS